MSLHNVGLWVAIAVVAVIAVTGTKSPEQVNVAASSGPDFYNPVYLAQTATVGGNVFATSSQGTATYVASTLVNTSLIQHTAGGALTVTLPASSTISFIQRAGDTRTIYLAPITTAISVAGGTGTDFNSASSSVTCLVNKICRLDFIRKTNSDIEVQMTN